MVHVCLERSEKGDDSERGKEMLHEFRPGPEFDVEATPEKMKF